MILISIFFAFSLIGIIIGGIATLATLVFAVLSLVAGKNEKAAYWSIGFAISISIVIFSVVQLIERVEHKVISGVEWLKKYENNLSTTSNSQTDYSKNERTNLLDSLKTLVDTKYKNAIPFSFYKNNKEQLLDVNTDTLPFIYPYAFEYKNYNFNLVDVCQKERSLALVENIAQVAYNGHFLLMKIDKTNIELKNNEPEISYLLFDLKMGTQKQFLNAKKLIEEASAMGYSGNTEMMYISDMYQAWFANDHD